jgi:hypothetical protein
MSWLNPKEEKTLKTFGKSRSTSFSSYGSSATNAPPFDIAVDVNDDPYGNTESGLRSRASTVSSGAPSARGLRVHNENTTGKKSPVDEKVESNAAPSKGVVKRKSSIKAEDNKDAKKKKEARTTSPVSMAPSPVQGATPGAFGQSGTYVYPSLPLRHIF